MRLTYALAGIITAGVCVVAGSASATVCIITCARGDNTTKTCWDFLTLPSQCQKIADDMNNAGNVCSTDWSLIGSCPASVSTVAPEDLIQSYLRSIRAKHQR